MSLVFVSVFREAYDRTKPTEEGRASALRGRLQSVDPTKLNARSSEVALAPRAAGRAEASLRALLLLPWDNTAGECPTEAFLVVVTLSGVKVAVS